MRIWGKSPRILFTLAALIAGLGFLTQAIELPIHVAGHAIQHNFETDTHDAAIESDCAVCSAYLTNVAHLGAVALPEACSTVVRVNIPSPKFFVLENRIERSPARAPPLFA